MVDNAGMKIKTLLISCLLCALLTPVQADKVLVYGDSLSAAYGMPQDQGWVALLDAEVQPAHQILNASISGETTTGGLGRLPATLTELKPDAVFLALGGNDALLGQPIEGIKANLQQMITLIRDSGAQPILAGIAVPPSYGPRYIDLFRKMYTDLAKETDVPFFDLYMPDIANNPTLMQGDGIHPTAEAQSQIKARIQQFLQTQLFVDAETQEKRSIEH